MLMPVVCRRKGGLCSCLALGFSWLTREGGSERSDVTLGFKTVEFPAGWRGSGERWALWITSAAVLGTVELAVGVYEGAADVKDLLELTISLEQQEASFKLGVVSDCAKLSRGGFKTVRSTNMVDSSVNSPRRMLSLSKERASVSILDDERESGFGLLNKQGAKPSEVYGFVGSISTIVATGLFLIWAYLPEPWLHFLGITYHPSRYWALAIPTCVYKRCFKPSICLCICG